MLNASETAVVCDLAETYHVFNYKSLPARVVATLAVGLRENSRIKMKMNEMRYPLSTMLLAAMLDRMSLFVWLNTQDGARGVNRPESVLDQLMGKTQEKEVIAFKTHDEFENAWKKITGGER